MVVEFDVGESSDRSSALEFCVNGSRFLTLPPSVAVGIQSVELIQRVQEILQLIAPKIAIPMDVHMCFRIEQEIDADWSELDEDVLVQIAENHLCSLDDFAMFSSVCRSWRHAAAACNVAKLNKKWIHNQVPWLMLTDGNTEVDNGSYTESDFVLPRVSNDIEEYDNERDCVKGKQSHYYDNVRDCMKGKPSHYYNQNYTRGVVNLRSQKRYNIICREGCGRVCWGSAYGWIVTAGGDGKMFMFNPVTKSHIDLPSFGTFRWRWGKENEIRHNRFVTTAVVLKVGGDGDGQSSGDGVEDLRVVAFYGDDHVAIVKPGNRRWVEIEGEARIYSPLQDVTYDSELGLVFVDNSGSLLCCKVPEKEESPWLEWFQRPVQSIHDENNLYDCVKTYIIKCGADLLRVTRVVDYDTVDSESIDNLRDSGYFFVDYYMTIGLTLSKYEFNKKKWVSANNTKDVALFLGNNASMWVDEPGGGSIYLTDDLRCSYHETKYKLGGHDCGVYNLKRHQNEHLYGAVGQRSSYCCPLFL